MFPLAASFGGYYALYVAVLTASVRLAVFLSCLVSADRLINISKFVYFKIRARLTGHLPEHDWAFPDLPHDPAAYPKVAVQLPMFNERAVCQAIIDCCCELHWPTQRLKIQVLDDSTDTVTRQLVDDKVLEWSERGLDIECLRRTNRQGYKAGAMKEGMDLLIKQGYLYVAVFDADFKPEPGFLYQTIPYLEGNPSVGYVQSRWVFTNPQESYLTKAQEVSLNYHMKCEQYTHSAAGSFFNFNGTAGVWRCACIETSGGWNSRTTVEDMDLSLRAYVRGWKAIFLDNVTCLNELPASFFAYRKQQHRWTCGPIQLWSKASKDIWASKLPLIRKLELIFMYFGVRKCATHFVSLGFFCTLVPLTMFTPEVVLPVWALVHLPVCVTLTTAAFTPRGWVYSILYVLFENAMGTVKLWAVVTGILDLQRAQEWVVTTKLGSSDKRPGATGTSVPLPSCRLYVNELAFSGFMLAAGAWGALAGAQMGMALYLLVQGAVFLAFGLNAVDAGGLLGGRLDDDVVLVPVNAAGEPLAAGPGADARRVPRSAASVGGGGLARPHPAAVGRTATIPVIQLDAPGALGALGDDEREEGTGMVFRKMEAPRLNRLNTIQAISVLDTVGAYVSGTSSASPSSDGSRTPDSVKAEAERGFATPGPMPGLMGKLGDMWPSPSSTLVAVQQGAAAARRGIPLPASLRAGRRPGAEDQHSD
ncbi:hypothetical protein ACKKBG_A16285 [Auxenochlorella protothecoides x Auxenochlorella symbiontica]